MRCAGSCLGEHDDGYMRRFEVKEANLQLTLPKRKRSA